MEQFAFQGEEKMEYKRSLSASRKLGKNSEEEKDSHSRLVNFLEVQLRNQLLEYSSQNSAYEAIDFERQRLQNQPSYLWQDLLQKRFTTSAQMGSVHLQEQLDEASDHSQDETKVHL